MPVALDQQSGAQGRRSRLPWLFVGLVFGLSLLLALLLTRPITVTFGEQVVLWGIEHVRWNRPPAPPYYALDEPRDRAGFPDGQVYTVKGVLHYRSLSLGDRDFYLAWFRGRRAPSAE
jgi:hypothetical protein